MYDDLEVPLTPEQAANDFRRPVHKRVFQALRVLSRPPGQASIVARLVMAWPHRLKANSPHREIAASLLIATTVRELLASLPPERQAAIEAAVQTELDEYFSTAEPPSVR